MVRQKNRWILVQLDFESVILSQCFTSELLSPVVAPEKKKRKLQTAAPETNNLSDISGADIYRSLQEMLTQSFGVVGASTTDVQVRLYDAKARLAVIKTTREKYPLVRSALTFLTQIKQQRVVITTIAVSGSARTARNIAWTEVRKRFFTNNDLGLIDKNEQWSKKSKAAMEKELLEFEERLDKIDSGC